MTRNIFMKPKHLALLSALTLSLCLALSGAANAKNLKGLEFGMSKRQVEKLLKRQAGKKAFFIDTICAIPLGTDFLGGLPVFTRDTGIRMLKAYKYGPLYFYKGELIAYRIDNVTIDDFIRLKKKFPSGRYSLFQYADESRIQAIFKAQSADKYVFTNRFFDAYVFNQTARKEAVKRVKGSFCWHSKPASPNLRFFAKAYAQCAKNDRRMELYKVEDDYESCKRFCAETPDDFASSECVSNCNDAFSRVTGAAPQGAEPEPTQETTKEQDLKTSVVEEDFGPIKVFKLRTPPGAKD